MYLLQDGSRNNLSDHFIGSLLRESKWLPKLASTCSLDLKKTALPVNILRLGGFSKRDFVNFSTRGRSVRIGTLRNFERSIAFPPVALPPLMPPKKNRVSYQFNFTDRTNSKITDEMSVVSARFLLSTPL